MAQDSQRLRLLRRVKRERSQLRQAVKVQQQQIQTVVKLLMDAQAELRKLKTPPTFTITTLADDVEPDTEADIAGLHDTTPKTIGYVAVDASPFIDPDYSEPVEDRQ